MTTREESPQAEGAHSAVDAQPKENHAHNHSGHSHEMAEQPSQRPYLIGISLNLIFVLSELVFAKLAHSTALFADAFHNLSDVLALVIAWLAVLVFGIKATRSKTYGWHNVSILASIFNTVLLLFAVGTIFVEGVNDLLNPAGIHTNGVMITIVAAIGIVVNVSTAMLFKASGVPDEHGHSHGHDQDLNAKTAYIHLLSDAGVSIGVILAGWLIKVTDWQIIDPIVSLLIGLIILVTAWPVMKETVNLAINGVPDSIDEAAIYDYLVKKEGVQSLHDLHIWPLSTTETALTVHLSLSEKLLSVHHGQEALKEIEEELKHNFGINHVTIQIESEQHEENCNTI